MVDRIQKLIQHKKLTASKFADQVGVPRSTISHILSGRNNPSLEFLQKILDTFPDVKTEWLIRGEGGMLVSRNTLFPDEEYEDKKQRLVFDRNLAENQVAIADFNESISQNTANISDSPGKGREIFKAEGDTGEEASAVKTTEYNTQSQEKSQSLKEEEIKPGSNIVPSKEILHRENFKKAVRVLFFYSDGTFAEFVPSE